MFRLIDTAGIRDSKDTIELIGVERSREKMKGADLVLYLFDVKEETKVELETSLSQLQAINSSYQLVGNKADIIGDEWATKKFDGIEALYISAKTHHHIDTLKEKLVEKVIEGKVNTESTIVTNARHYNSLLQVQKSLTDITPGTGCKHFR